MNSKLFIVSMVIFSLFLVSCGPSENVIQEGLEETEDLVIMNSSTPELTSTLTPEPTFTSTLIPTPTLTPTPTITPTPTQAAISRTNLENFALIRSIGNKETFSTFDLSYLSPSSELMAISGPINNQNTGIIYETNDFDIVASFQNLTNLVFSNDESRIVGNNGGFIEIWDISKGEPLLTFEGSSNVIQSLAWSSETGEIAGVDTENQFFVWNSNTGEEIFFEQLPEPPYYSDIQLEYSSLGTHLSIIGIDSTLRIWDGETINDLTRHSGLVAHASWSPDGQFLATCGERDTHAYVWRMSNNNVILDLATHFYRADNLAWSPTGEKIATVDAEGTIRIWNASGGRLLQTFIHISNPNSIVWSPDGSKIAVLYDAVTIKVFDVMTKQEYVQPEGMLTANDEILWVGDRILLLNRDARMQSWNIQSDETEMLINPSFGSANLISLSHGGDKLAYVEQGGNLLIIDMKTGDILFNVNTKITDYVRDIAYSWNNKLIAIASNRKVILVNVETGEIKAIMEDRTYGSFTSLSWPMNESQLLIGTGDGKILIWDIETTEVINLLEMYETSILDLATSQNGVKLAAIGVRGEIYIWNTDDWNRESILQGSNEYLVVADLEFTPDGNHLASFGLLWETLYDGARYQLWDLNSNELLIEWFGDPGFLLATSISFSPDGSFLASSFGEIWDPFTGELLQRFKFDSAASDIVWTPDNKNVIITGDLVEFWGIIP